MAFNRDPKTKSEIIDRLLRRDFTGDLTELGADKQVILERKGANILAMKFQNSGEVFELTVHKRRDQPMRKRAALSRRAVEARSEQVLGGNEQGQDREHPRQVQKRGRGRPRNTRQNQSAAVR